jgi:hypothetical protein
MERERSNRVLYNKRCDVEQDSCRVCEKRRGLLIGRRRNNKGGEGNERPICIPTQKSGIYLWEITQVVANRHVSE